VSSTTLFPVLRKLTVSILSFEDLTDNSVVLHFIRPGISKGFIHDPVLNNVNAKGGLVAGGKPPLGPKSKDYSKVTATHSDPHLPVLLGDVERHREPQPFSLHSPFFDSKVFAARFLFSGVGSFFFAIQSRVFVRNDCS
jgi:hypothetical protein